MEKFCKVRRIGSSPSADIFVAHDDELGIDVCVKRFHEKSKPLFYKELSAHLKNSVNGIVKMIDFNELGNEPYLVLEYLPFKDIGTFCEKNKQSLSKHELLKLVADIWQTLNLLHQKSFVHGDVKPSNILLSKKHGEVSFILSDLGCLSEMSKIEEGLIPSGTPLFRSPDVNALEYNFWCDLYSLGVTLMSLIMGVEVLSRINVKDKNLLLELIEDQELRSIISYLFCPMPLELVEQHDPVKYFIDFLTKPVSTKKKNIIRADLCHQINWLEFDVTYLPPIYGGVSKNSDASNYHIVSTYEALLLIVNQEGVYSIFDLSEPELGCVVLSGNAKVYWPQNAMMSILRGLGVEYIDYKNGEIKSQFIKVSERPISAYDTNDKWTLYYSLNRWKAHDALLGKSYTVACKANYIGEPLGAISQQGRFIINTGGMSQQIEVYENGVKLLSKSISGFIERLMTLGNTFAGIYRRSISSNDLALFVIDENLNLVDLEFGFMVIQVFYFNQMLLLLSDENKVYLFKSQKEIILIMLISKEFKLLSLCIHRDRCYGLIVNDTGKMGLVHSEQLKI